MNIANFREFPLLMAFACIALCNPCAAQYSAALGMPKVNSAQLMEDQQKLPALREYYQQYKLQIDMYVEDMQAKAAAADDQIQQYENERLLLDKKISDNPKQAEASTQLKKLDVTLNQQRLLKSQIAQNVNTALAWLNYVRDQVDSAEHDLVEDQQQLASDMTQLQQARAEQAWQNQLQAIEAQQMQSQQYNTGGGYADWGDGYLGPSYYRNRNHGGIRLAGKGAPAGVAHGGGTVRSGGAASRAVGGGAVSRGGGGGSRGGGGGHR